MFRKLAVTLVVPVLLGAAACAEQADETTVLTGDAAVAALRAAPEAAADAGSGRFEMTMSFTTPEGAVDLTATGAYRGEQASMEMELGSALGGLAGASGETLPAGFDEPMQIVVDGTRTYMRIPMFQALTGDSSWLSVTPEDMGLAGGSLGIGATANDPAQLLETLRGVADDVTVRGSEEVRGVPTTRYSGTIDLAKAVERTPAAQREMLEPMLEGIDTSRAGIPVDVWIDQEGLARRMTMHIDDLMAEAMGSAAEGAATVSVEFFDYGDDISIDVPDPSETKPFAEVLGALGGPS